MGIFKFSNLNCSELPTSSGVIKNTSFVVIQIAAHFIILMILTQVMFLSYSFLTSKFRVCGMKSVHGNTHKTGSVSRECVTVLYCHVCNVAMELGAKPLVTHGSYSEGVVLSVSILGCEEIFLSSVVKYCVWVKKGSDDALEGTVITWHVQILYFICTLYTGHLRYSP